jgi:DNA topoisomerase-1
VTISGDEIEFCFRGKNNKLVKRTVENAKLARELRRLVALENGSRLFRYEREGETFNLTAPTFNAYIGEHLGNGFTAKDFRTGAAPCSRPSSSAVTGRPRARPTPTASSRPSCARSAQSSGIHPPSRGRRT